MTISLKLRAAKLTKYMVGLFKQADVYKKCRSFFRDACIAGTGYLKIFEENDQIKQNGAQSEKLLLMKWMEFIKTSFNASTSVYFQEIC